MNTTTIPTKMFMLCVIAILQMALCLSANRPVPPYLHICRKSDPNLIGCMRKSIETIRPYLIRGIPELDIPSIDPIDIGDLLVSEKTQSNGVQITAKNIKSYGSSKYVLRNLDVVDYGNLYTFEVYFPYMYVEGTYDVNGQVLLLPIRGSGKFAGNFTDCTGNVRLQFARTNTDQVQIKKFLIKIKVGRGSIKLFNLFNGEKTLGDAVNAVINENFDVVSQDVIPLVEKALQKTLKRIATKITQNFKYDQVFPL